jgi:taurine dioxygenase
VTAGEALLDQGSASTGLRFRPVAALVGAEIVDFPPLEKFSDVEVDGVRAGLAQYGVVFLRTGSLDVASHVQFARRLGELTAPSALIETLADAGFPDVGVISTENGLAYSSDRWHSDVTWRDEPSKYSILHMQECPPVGGDTMWASQYAAFASLSERMKSYLIGLTAHHMAPGRSELGADHPVVCRHPLTGRQALFVNNLFVTCINEIPEAESDGVLRFLSGHCVRPEFTCRWSWQSGDIAVWDNHFVQHYALGDYHPARRKIHRIEVRGEAPLPSL